MAISGSPTVSSRRRLSVPIRSSESRCKLRVDARAGCRRRGSGRPGCGTARRYKRVGRKPLDQLAAPPLMPLPVDITTKAGRSVVSAPRPYVTHEPRLGRPGCEKPRVEKDLRRRVIELIGVHRLDQADVVDHFGQVGQHLRELRARLAVPGKLETRAQHGRVGADECIPLPADDLRRNAACPRARSSLGL